MLSPASRPAIFTMDTLLSGERAGGSRWIVHDVCYAINASSTVRLVNRGCTTMNKCIDIQGKSIRTDWIHKIERGKENGMITCTIWFAVGPVSVYAFKGKDAQ